MKGCRASKRKEQLAILFISVYRSEIREPLWISLRLTSFFFLPKVAELVRERNSLQEKANSLSRNLHESNLESKASRYGVLKTLRNNNYSIIIINFIIIDCTFCQLNEKEVIELLENLSNILGAFLTKHYYSSRSCWI